MSWGCEVNMIRMHLMKLSKRIKIKKESNLFKKALSRSPEQRMAL